MVTVFSAVLTLFCAKASVDGTRMENLANCYLTYCFVNNASLVPCFQTLALLPPMWGRLKLLGGIRPPKALCGDGTVPNPEFKQKFLHSASWMQH